MTKSIDREDELNNNDNLKNSAPTLKDSKGKPKFTKSVISTWFSLHIQAQFNNLTSTVKPSSSTSSQSRLSISFYQDSTTSTLTSKYKNTDMFQLKPKYHTTEAFKKNKIIQSLKIKFVEKWDELTIAEKKMKKAE